MNVAAQQAISQPYVVKKLSVEDVDSLFQQQWRDLIDRAVEPIAYLDPGFVMPALDELYKARPVIRAVYRQDPAQPLLVGLGLFAKSLGDKRLPFPHLSAFKTEHSFLSGLIIDQQQTDAILSELIDSLAREFWYLAGIRFVDFPVEDKLGQQLSALPRTRWFGFWDYQRAIYCLPVNIDDTWFRGVSKERRKKYRSYRRKLESLGTLQWRLLRADDITQQVVDDFLEVEHCGWKGEDGTSILSNPAHTRFFKAMVAQLKKNDRIFFTELRLNDQLIAASSNLIVHARAFAFKVGWHTDYKPYSPGIVNEIEFLMCADQQGCGFSVIESGTTEGSFIESYWPERWLLAEGVLSIHWFSRILNTVNNSARTMVKRLIGRT